MVCELSQAGKIICPLADQEGEVWINRKDWVDTIRELSLGIECLSLKEVQDNQLHKAMSSYHLGYSGDSIRGIKGKRSNAVKLSLTYSSSMFFKDRQNKLPVF